METEENNLQQQAHVQNPIACDSNDITRQTENGTHQNIAKALSKLSVQNEKVENESNEQSLPPSASSSSKAQTEDTMNSTNEQVDPALVEAMRVPRDKVFIRKYEKEMEDQIRNTQVIQWELPLMNTYQRMLVHRIADHYGLGHSLDPTTRQVTLVKKESTQIPEVLVSVLAAKERLSDPVDFPPLHNSLSGQSTPASGSTPAQREPPTGVRIMLREAGSNRSGSRNGSNTPDDGNGSRKDNKNKTMQEREASYKEARERIFGKEEAKETNSEATERPSSNAPCLDRKDLKNVGLSRSSSPSFSSGSTVTPRKATSHDESGTASSSEYPPQNAPVSHLPISYPYSTGGWQGMQVDAYGRPFQPQAWPPIQAQYAYDPQAPSFPSPYADNASISSRSTSISTSTEGAGSANSSISEQFASPQPGQSNYSTSSLLNSAMMQGRSQSASPISPFVPRTQTSSGNSTPGGSYAYPQSATSPPQSAPWGTTGQPYYGHLNYSTPPSPMDNNRNQYIAANSYVNPNGANGQYNPGYLRQSMQGNGAWSHAVPQGTHFGNVPAQQMPQQDPYMGTGRGRGRVSQGSERGLYDPNKPPTPKSASSTSSNRHSLGKSSSAAAVLENGLNQHRMSGSSGMSTPISSRAITPNNDQLRRSSSSNTRNGHPAPPATGSTSSLSSISSINHPSLPARPNWVTRQSGSSQSVQSNVTEIEVSNAESTNGNGITSNADNAGVTEINRADLNGQETSGKGIKEL
ncbi:uncharacterized protein FA14DRAFT_173499 [Meira miltonrushii]|uniref:SUZ domain-containing protein n=1 Tax=Meira miltonrushii TaxID=1280837 RepID=A0A316VCM4_9BASI|nr:uncharacterized protein FA14DRAFT_173499 [Meira miltonrushii]PWN33741.1 hypothetical protein FA14DRAFT_173499 [Meira miltonrushii]